MECCDFCGAPLLAMDLRANPRYGYDLCGHCVAEMAEFEAGADEEYEVA